ncbi:protein of unknown function DUF547 [Dillenia turbinata]|uniref:Ternary complex factor MIP1 leucine-zipper domain-containing protein n=1 Tax=Dillenia turbinata TaxID=194707 RepID=A0AAN8V4Y5_9MAGN
MGFEASGDSKMQELKLTPRHKHSKSYPGKKEEEMENLNVSSDDSRRLKLDIGHYKDPLENKNFPEAGVHSSLKQEILQLEKRLQEQFVVRHALEKALGYRTSSQEPTSEISMPKPATELIKEIAVLELEVVYLEQYLLSLYRKAFGQQISTFSPSLNDVKFKSLVATPKKLLEEVPSPDIPSNRESKAVQSSCPSVTNTWKESNGVGREEKQLDSGVHRCHSSLSQRSTFSKKSSPPVDSLSKAVRACHSQPLSIMEYAESSLNVISLAEHLGTRISDHVPETPNRISEDMVKCMSTIYCKLADPPLTHHGLSSPSSSLSSGAFSPHNQYDMWSPGFKKDSSFDKRLDDPFHVEGLKEFSGPYNTMIEVPFIYRDNQKLVDIDHMLQNFRTTRACCIPGLWGSPKQCEENVLTPEEWTDIALLLQWLRMILSPRSKFRNGDERQEYAIDHPEPLLHFALCSGSHSDPAVRIYTPKRVQQELEAAKEEYIRATFEVRKDHKILLPKLVESFAKDSGLCPAGLMEMIQRVLPDSLRKNVKKCQLGKSRKSIEWVPHSFAFRYLISKELVK